MYQQTYTDTTRVDIVATRCAEVLRHTARILDREVVPRLGFAGMTALTLLVLALIQALLPRVSWLGGASVPVLWSAICYYVLRFRIRRGMLAAFAGSLLSCLALDGPMVSTGGVTLVLSLGFLLLGRWMYAEFWPAHALASTGFALLVPLVAWVIGVPVVYSGMAPFFGTVCAAPFASVIVFGLLEWTRCRLGVTILFGDEEETERPASPECMQRPSLARGTGM